MPPPGRGSCRSPAGRCRCSTRASARSTSRCGRRSASSTSATWARSRRVGRTRRRSCSASSPTTSAKIAEDGAQYTRAHQARRRRAGRPLHLPPRPRPLPHRHERVQPREGPRVVPAARARASTSTVHDRLHDYAMLAVQGPEAPRAGRAARRRRAPQALPHRHDDRRGRADVLVAGTGYTGEDGVELLLAAASTRPTVWDALDRSRRRRPIGLGARDTLRLEVCFHLYGNDLSEDRNPIEAGLGWCCKEDTGFIGADKIAAARENGTARAARPLRPHRPRHRPPGQPDHRRRRGHVRHALARA